MLQFWSKRKMVTIFSFKLRLSNVCTDKMTVFQINLADWVKETAYDLSVLTSIYYMYYCAFILHNGMVINFSKLRTTSCKI